MEAMPQCMASNTFGVKDITVLRMEKTLVHRQIKGDIEVCGSFRYNSA